MIQKKRLNKKAVSLMVSYVLLIVISLSLAGMVYGFLKFKAQLPDEIKCPEQVALIIKDYSCDADLNIIQIEIQNKGLFNVNGFFIRATNNTNILPNIPLKRSGTQTAVDGRYDFGTLENPKPLKPSEPSVSTEFSYAASVPLITLQIQPFVLKEGGLGLCQNTITLDIDNSKNCI